MFQILIVDDDKNLKRGLSLLLTDSGYRTFFADNVKEALHTLEKCRIDLMLLEAALPGTDGLTLTRLLRDCKNDLPILMLSSRKHPADIKKGFLAGVDDYVTKPFDPEELTLRIKALLRRAKNRFRAPACYWKYRLGLRHLLRHHKWPGADPSAERILSALQASLLSKPGLYPPAAHGDIWGPASESTPATVSVHINRLRSVSKIRRFFHCYHPRSRLQIPDPEIVTVQNVQPKQATDTRIACAIGCMRSFCLRLMGVPPIPK